MKMYCKNCGKKFYAKTWSGYPQTEWGVSGRVDVPEEHKHFHSQSCFKEWVAKNHEAFTIFVDNVSQNVIEDNQTINQQKG